LRWPLGRRAFSAYGARYAPYFKTISPLINMLEPNRCEVLIKKRKRVENHIGTVHVIAIANGLEMAMGFMAEASIPKHLRWIPKGMELSYPNKAASDIVCRATVPAPIAVKTILSADSLLSSCKCICSPFLFFHKTI